MRYSPTMAILSIFISIVVSAAVPSSQVQLRSLQYAPLNDLNFPFEKQIYIDSLPYDIILYIVEFLAPIAIPKNVSSEVAAMALYALGIALKRFKFSFVFG